LRNFAFVLHIYRKGKVGRDVAEGERGAGSMGREAVEFAAGNGR